MESTAATMGTRRCTPRGYESLSLYPVGVLRWTEKHTSPNEGSPVGVMRLGQ